MPIGSRGTRICSLPGCSEFVYRNPESGREYHYCGRTHARLAEDRGLTGVEEPNVDRVYRVRGWVHVCVRVCECM